MRKKNFLALSFFSLLFFSAYFARGQNIPVRGIEDDSYLREAVKASWLLETPGNVFGMRPEIHTLGGGSRVQISVEISRQYSDEFAVVFARERNGSFSGRSRGTWILYRFRTSGEASRIQVFLRNDANTYVQFRPFSGEKCFMDVVIYNAFVIRSLPLPVPFESLYSLPVEKILDTAGARFPSRYFFPDPAVYEDSRKFIASVRSGLPGLEYADDGAIDENGAYVFIESLASQDSSGSSSARGLNCSGFAKWIVDGILRPVTGERLSVAPLKLPYGERGASSMEHWEEVRDQYFGLDWCRNLASAAVSVLRSPAFSTLEEIEVRDWPFSGLIMRQGEGYSVYNYPGFISTAGFAVEGLLPLLYTLAVNEPNRIYLAAVNDEIGAPVTPDNPRGLPRLRQFYHIAVLVPFFTEDGSFRIAVFESAAETSFSGFAGRYPGQFVNLVRIPIEGRFDP